LTSKHEEVYKKQRIREKGSIFGFLFPIWQNRFPLNMTDFDPTVLRSLRKDRGLTITSLAKKLQQSPAQVHRLENGQRRITVDLLLRYCDALGVEIGQLFQKNPMIPIIGVINAEFEVLPMPPNTPYQTRAPGIVPDPERLAAVRWEPAKRFSKMHGHLCFFYADVEGIPDAAWGQRCIIRRRNGTQVIGWPIRQGDQIHIDNPDSAVEFSADIVWASPILAVFSPVAFDLSVLSSLEETPCT
jgi:transcriptional regulator with XRE-family HTH domain